MLNIFVSNSFSGAMDYPDVAAVVLIGRVYWFSGPVVPVDGLLEDEHGEGVGHLGGVKHNLKQNEKCDKTFWNTHKK